MVKQLNDVCNCLLTSLTSLSVFFSFLFSFTSGIQFKVYACCKLCSNHLYKMIWTSADQVKKVVVYVYYIILIHGIIKNKR